MKWYRSHVFNLKYENYIKILVKYEYSFYFFSDNGYPSGIWPGITNPLGAGTNLQHKSQHKVHQVILGWPTHNV